MTGQPFALFYVTQRFYDINSKTKNRSGNQEHFSTAVYGHLHHGVATA
jgi:hypothetical protein